MGVTKTDFMRGIQCPRMLWLDKHHPEYRIIPKATQDRLDRGNAFGDTMMSIFGPFTEVKEYKPGTKIPDKERMTAKTAELLADGTSVICEAAFMDADGNYCAVDILRWDSERSCYDLYEVKNSPEVSDQFIRDAGFQAYLIRKTGLALDRIYIVYHGEEPYEIQEVTDRANAFSAWVAENIGRLGRVKAQEEEVFCPTGAQCCIPYECWYYEHCKGAETIDSNCLLLS